MKSKTIYFVYGEKAIPDESPVLMEAFETRDDAQTYIDTIKASIISEQKYETLKDALNECFLEISEKYWNTNLNEPLYEGAEMDLEKANEDWESKGKYKYLEECGCSERDYDLAEYIYEYQSDFYIDEITYNYND